MGVPAQSLKTTHDVRPRAGRRGVALAAALAALVIVGVFATIAWGLATVNRRAAVGRVGAAQALLLAEAGAAHALALLTTQLKDTSVTRLLRGDDDRRRTPDDGVLTGFGLAPADEIPAAGRAMDDGRYYVQLLEDPAMLGSGPFQGERPRSRESTLLARSRGVTDDGAAASIDVIIGPMMPAILIGGTPDRETTVLAGPDRWGRQSELMIGGWCAGVHSNVDLHTGTERPAGALVVDGPVSAAGNVRVTGELIHRTSHQLITPARAPPISIPELDPRDYWPDCDVRFNGSTTIHAHNYPYVGRGRGTSLCVDGNVSLIADAPRASWLSIFATGYVDVFATGNNVQRQVLDLIAAHESGIAILTASDFRFDIRDAITPHITGLVYAGSHCEIRGELELFGQLVCRAAVDLGIIGFVTIAASGSVSYDCQDWGIWPRRVVAWYPRLPS